MSVLTQHPTYTFEAPATATKLPGFVENGVTYQSHTFYVDFGKPGYHSGPDCTIYVRHGGGWESLRTSHMIATALASLLAANDTRAAFFLCWGTHETARESYKLGRFDVATQYRTAFIEGRLKKRRLPRGGVKFWIEDAPATPVASA